MAKSALTVYLKEVATGELRAAELHDGIHERHLTDLDEIWRPALTVLQRLAGPENTEESAHWNWRAKLKHARRRRSLRSFAIVFHDVTQGLMIVDTSRTARLEPDRDRGLVYVDYVEVAPWNRRGWKPHRLYHSVGTVLLRSAIQVSQDMGFRGRIGLHSLPQSDRFYLRQGLTRLGADPEYENLNYFEMTSEQALAMPLEHTP